MVHYNMQIGCRGAGLLMLKGDITNIVYMGTENIDLNICGTNWKKYIKQVALTHTHKNNHKRACVPKHRRTHT